MKTLFFGTSAFAVPSLEAAAQRTELQGVVTQPDRPAGRGQKITAPPVKVAAQKLGVQVYQPASLRDFAAELSGRRFDFFILASYGKLIPQALLDVPELGSLNVHPSLLPQYRGATPIQAALRDGASETGVTIMLMDAGLDTGDVVLQERTPILPGETYGELHDRLARFGAQALMHAIDAGRGGSFPRVPQSGKATVTRPLRKEDFAIDWNWEAQRIVNHVRSLSPSPAARAVIANTPVKILRAEVAQWERPLVEPGTIASMIGDGLGVQSGNGVVNVLEVIAPNRGPQTGASFGAQFLRAST
ncbi:MAG TPA: methionyl-tRNA formyltransferase [Candidatus Rubrimentiphilum sp.]|nr:methionyl-tRNA formyltransferase [Candidatus Rubrimentiphilum sp.]